MTNTTREIELVRKLKASYPDLLDFNNCLKELRKFWKAEYEGEELEFLCYILTGTGYTKEYYIKMLEERKAGLFKELEK